MSRRAALALALSAAIHAALLGGLLGLAGFGEAARTGTPPHRSAAATTRVRLLGGSPGAPAAAQVAAPARRSERRRPRVLTAPESAPATVAIDEPEQGGEAPDEAVGDAPAAPASGPAGGEAPGPVASMGEGVTQPRLEELHRRLAAAASRCYPDAARRFRARGRVTLSFCLDERGGAASASIAAGSGSALLDRAATDCVLPGALPLPGAAGCYTVPVVFGDAT